MSDTLVAFVDDLTAIVKERNKLREENASLKEQLAAFQNSFGKNEVTWKGPRRINRRKLEHHEVRQIINYHSNGVRVTELARMYDVAHSTISRIISGVYHRNT